MTQLHLIYVYMQVYLEVPNGENLAAALHSKVITVRLIKYAFRIIYFLLKIVVDYVCFMCREFLM